MHCLLQSSTLRQLSNPSRRLFSKLVGCCEAVLWTTELDLMQLVSELLLLLFLLCRRPARAIRIAAKLSHFLDLQVFLESCPGFSSLCQPASRSLRNDTIPTRPCLKGQRTYKAWGVLAEATFRLSERVPLFGNLTTISTADSCSLPPHFSS
jgi:hypothetical protein